MVEKIEFPCGMDGPISGTLLVSGSVAPEKEDYRKNRTDCQQGGRDFCLTCLIYSIYPMVELTCLLGTHSNRQRYAGCMVSIGDPLDV